jgi:nucleotide-binding universal stress UspA family protein
MNRILACIDPSTYAASVCDLAAWAAVRLPAGIELLHVVQRKSAIAARHDLSGAIGFGVKGDLLEELTRIDEADGRLAIERGRALLAGSQERLRAAGVADVALLHRHGGIVETIIERESEADLVVIGKRGASGEFAVDHIGSKVERVVRASTRPVFVAPQAIGAMDTAVIAFDGSPSATRALRFVASSPLFAGMALHLVMAGTHSASHLEGPLARLAEDGRKATPFVSDGRADKVIGDHVAAHPASLLVMGAYGHSPLRTLIVGSTTSTMIRTMPVPILLMR